MRAAPSRKAGATNPNGYNGAMDNRALKGKTIGILALQGDYDKHRDMLEERIGAPTKYVRNTEELTEVDALILPGGESTTIAKLMDRIGLDGAIRDRATKGMPIYGTCAGMILLAKSIDGRPDQPTLGLMDIVVARNAFGRQVDSFETDIPFQLGDADSRDDVAKVKVAEVRGVFIRAPYVTSADSTVHVISRYKDRIVGVRQGNILATAFHPELTEDPQVHAYFLKIVEESR